MANNNNKQIDNDVGEALTRQMLFDLNLEQTIIGHITTLSSMQVQEVREIIHTEDFYDASCRLLWRMVMKLNNEGSEVDMMSLMPEVLKTQGQKYEIDLAVFADICTKNFTTLIDLHQHIAILVDYSRRRQLWFLSQQLEKDGTCIGADLTTVIDRTKNTLDEIMSGRRDSTSVTMQQVLENITNRVGENLAGLHEGEKTLTGFDWIDNHGGLQSPDLNIIAAESSVGKSAWSLSIVQNVINQGKPCVFYTMEMSKEQLVARLLSKPSKLYSHVMLNDKLDSYQYARFNKGVNALWESSQYLYFEDKSTITISAIIASIRRHVTKYGVKGAVIDFIQRIGGRDKGELDTAFYARVCQALKNLCLELNIWIIALSQLNRNYEDSKNSTDDTRYIPTLNRLRGSGEIVEAADNIWFIYRPDYYNKKYGKSIKYPAPNANVSTEGTAMILVAKGRNVGDGVFFVGFDAPTTNFYNLDDLPKVDTSPFSQSTNNSVETIKIEINNNNNTKQENYVQGEMPF